MYRVRIKTSPNGGTHKTTGDQEQYGLVRNLAAMQNAPQATTVNNKMGAIPREHANIEVEGGESVIGDVNQDGTMELMHFVGKRHSEGGIPVNIPEGSFIFSDTKSLTIKDREVIEKIFNLPYRKQGYTPGEISKKYEINTYVEILKDENADPLAKRSAAEMLKKNKQKLGILAFIQESMKGFPDGIPAIAEEVLSTMGIDPNQMAQQFAPPQPEQGMGMGQGMMPPMEGQGIPMSEGEDAMAGMMPEGPAVAPDDLANQMQGQFGGTMPEYAEAGTVGTPDCPFGYKWNPHVKACVTIPYANVSVKGLIPTIAYNNYFGLAPKSQPKKSTVSSDDDDFSQNLRRQIEEGNRKSQGKTPPSLTTSGKRPSQEPLGDNSAAAQFKRNNPGAGTEAFEKERKARLDYQKQVAEKEAAEYNKKEAEKNKAAAEDRAKNPYKYNVPGFGKKSDLDEYMSQNAEQYTAGDIFYKALNSGDPAQMLSAAKDIKKIDVPWSIGWMPFTDQDKIDDMYTILHEEALKKLNRKQKDIITKNYDVKTVTKKLNDVIANFEKQRDSAVDLDTKLKLAKTVQKYKKYKDVLINNKNYESWYKGVQKSKVTPNSSSWFGFLDYDLGNPIQDVKYGYDDDQTLMSYLEDIVSQHDRIKGTNVLISNPLAFKGQTRSGGSGRGDTLSWGDESDSFEVFDTEGKVQEVYDRLYKNDNTPSSAKNYKPEYKISTLPNSVFRVDTDANGNAVWTEYTADGAEIAVSDAEIVKQLNKKATQAESAASGKPVVYAIKPAANVGDGSIIDILNQEKKLNPQSVTPSGRQSSTNTSNQTPRNSTIAPIAPSKPKENKFDNGLTEDDFKLERGGVVGQTMKINGQVFRYGGLIDEDGMLRYNRGGSVLPEYSGGGTPGAGDPPKEELVDGNFTTSNGTKAKKYKQIYTDPNGGPPTTIVVIRDAGDETKILGRMNVETGESYKDPNMPITRASSTWVTADNLNDWEKKQVQERWNGDTQAFIDFQNSNNQIRLNKELRDDIVKQYREDVKDSERRMYTGKVRGTRDRFYNKKDDRGNAYSVGVEKLADDPDEIINTMMNFERNNARLAAYGLDAKSSTQNVAALKSDGTFDPNLSDYQGKYVNKEARQIIKDNFNKGLDDLDFSNNYLGQGTYISYRRALINNADKYKDFATFDTHGVDDETTFGIKGRVSGIDNYNTNTTLGQRLGYKPKPPQPKITPGKKQAFYCVEYSDGSKDVQTVEYEENGTPTTPSGELNGKTVSKAQQYETLELANTNCQTTPTKRPPEDIPRGVPQPQTWFAPDIVNLNTAIRQRVPHPSAVLRQMPQIYSGYDLNNPITQIASAHGLAKQKQDLAMNTLDATVANAVTANEGYEGLASGISGVEKDNVNTVNNYLGRIGALQYQYDAANMQGQRQFDVDYNVGIDEFAGNLNARDAQVAGLYGAGWGNVQKDNSLRVAYPNAWHAQRLTPTFAWSGYGKNPLAPDTSVTPGGYNTGQTDCSAVYTQAYNSVKNDASRDEQAKKDYASRMEASCIQQNNSRATSQNKTNQQNYSGGLNSNVRWSQFGGTYTAPSAYEYEFGGTYFDDF